LARNESVFVDDNGGGDGLRRARWTNLDGLDRELRFDIVMLRIAARVGHCGRPDDGGFQESHGLTVGGDLKRSRWADEKSGKSRWKESGGLKETQWMDGNGLKEDRWERCYDIMITIMMGVCLYAILMCTLLLIDFLNDTFHDFA